ncbi:MAG: substrate-binding domain-containing protein [Phycisphaerae bacterium]
MITPKIIPIGVQLPTEYIHALRVLQGIRRYIRQQPRMRIATSGVNPVSLPEQLHANYCAGVITMLGERTDQAWLRRLKLPIVNVSNRLPSSLCPRVASDDVACGRLMAEHLLGLGYRHFMYIPLLNCHFSILRGQGFCAVLQAAGHTCHVPVDAGSDFQLQATELLKTQPRPLAIGAATDNRARTVINLATHLGLRIPEDLVVVGCDNDPREDALSDVAISSVIPDFETLGFQAAALLERLITGAKPPKTDLLIPPIGLIERQSTQGIPSSDPDLQQIVAWMRTHCQDSSLAINAVADANAISRRTMERKFLNQLNCGPNAMLLQLRLQKARELLTGTQDQIGQIAKASGFCSEYYFSRVFRQELHMTPTEYRAKYRF